MKTKLSRASCLLLLLMGLVFLRCGDKRILSQQEYVRFLNSGKCELNATKTADRIRFHCKLQTPELITLLTREKDYSHEKEFEADKINFSKHLNVVFVIEDEGKKDHRIKETIFSKENYGSLLAYSNTELQNDFSLQLANGETVPCSFVHLEAANSVQPVIRIVISFKDVDITVKDYSIIFDDKLFNTGRLKFHYGQEVFSGLPTLKI